LSFLIASIADIWGLNNSQAYFFNKFAAMGITFVTGAALLFTWNSAVADILQLTVTAISTVVEVDEIISGIQSTVFSDLLGNGRGVLA
jgi:hypothetical protein